MGLKCSLLGHSFDEADVEREREERGSQVVTKVREVERCSRCGKTRVVSENKEVTSVIEPEDDDDDEIDADDIDTDFDGDTPVQLQEEPNPEDEDAEILDSGEEQRAPGQWPDDDEPWEPEAAEGGAEPAEAGGDQEPAGEPATGGAETGGADGEILEPGESSSAPEQGGAAAEEPSRAPTTGADDITVPEGSYVCPECGFTAAVENSSLREGDACPECQRGYLTTERNS